jgi:outer membrane protein OmpA-like peptidoglycan-associated protein
LPEVQIIGHTDTVGRKEDNYYLGLKRAEVMEKIVLEAGVSKEIIEINSLGEEDPFIKSGDEKDEPLNRRVEITVK